MQKRLITMLKTYCDKLEKISTPEQFGKLLLWINIQNSYKKFLHTEDFNYYTKAFLHNNQQYIDKIYKRGNMGIFQINKRFINKIPFVIRKQYIELHEEYIKIELPEYVKKEVLRNDKDAVVGINKAQYEFLKNSAGYYVQFKLHASPFIEIIFDTDYKINEVTRTNVFKLKVANSMVSNVQYDKTHLYEYMTTSVVAFSDASFDPIEKIGAYSVAVYKNNKLIAEDTQLLPAGLRSSTSAEKYAYVQALKFLNDLGYKEFVIAHDFTTPIHKLFAEQPLTKNEKKFIDEILNINTNFVLIDYWVKGHGLI